MTAATTSVRDELIWIPREAEQSRKAALDALGARPDGWRGDPRIRRDLALRIMLRSLQRQALLSGIAIPWEELRPAPPF